MTRADIVKARTSPWVRRAEAGNLPPSAHGARAYSGRDTARVSIDDVDASALRIDTRAGTYTVADLQRAVAREIER